MFYLFNRQKSKIKMATTSISSVASEPEHNTKSRELEEENATKTGAADDEDTGAQVAPIVKLEEVPVTTGEEDEDAILDLKAKLYRFDKEGSQWKERGVGTVKLLKHKESAKVRLVFRQSKTLKICANHLVLPTINVQEHHGNDKSCLWHAADFADGELKDELFCIRFPSVENCKTFKETVEEVAESQGKKEESKDAADAAGILEKLSVGDGRTEEKEKQAKEKRMDTKIGSLDTCKPTSNDMINPTNATVSTVQNSVSSTIINPSQSTLGRHLARRLVQIGVTDVFSVPGDFNLTLLDHLIAEPGLNLIGCCNELNAGYAADGYARSRGVGACVVTFTVGGLSVLNAIAGANSENLPVICIVGGPNSNDYGTNRILHHTIGLPDFSQELRCFQTVTCYQAVVNNLEDAHEQIDTAISTALKENKPVYINVSCNLSAIPHPAFSREPVPFSLSPKMSNELGLEAAVEAAAEFLNKAVKPILVGGPKLRPAHASEAFVELADACGYALAIMPSAKGLVPEHHPHFVGTYWGAVSSAFCAEIVESADAYLFAGPIFNDYSSVGYSLLLKKEKAIIVQPDRVVIANGPAFGCVLMKDFFVALAKKIKPNTTAYDNYQRIFVPEGEPLRNAPEEPLRVNVLFQHVQKMLSSETAVIAETGDSWFNCQKLKLPRGCGYEFQMQYGSIGWSVGATLGYAQAVPEKRVIACIGDGSFQVTAQDVSTMLRCRQKTIIFLINNGGYTIEVEIHDGPYNVIKNWNYTSLVDAIHNGEGKCWTAKVFCEDELVEAIETATGPEKDSLCFIEVIVHKDDTSKELLEWGSRVSAANSRQPNPQ